jgi:hypothetical protein
MPDWRLQGQERFLMKADLFHRIYRPYREGWDHDHCEFCCGKFSTIAGDFNEGYATNDLHHWICGGCFNDFKGMFDWRLDSNPAAAQDSGPHSVRRSTRS